MYSGQFTNYSITPVKFVACDYTSDTLTAETEFSHGLQRWNFSTNYRETIYAIESEDYCQPMPAVGGGNHIVSKWIFPFQSTEVVSDEATGAREPFRQGDKARFVVFKDVSNGNAWENAIFSEAFVIEDNVIRDKNPPSRRVIH